MLKQFSKMNSLTKIFDSTLVTLPAPVNLSVFWNMGSLLSMCLITQIVTGLLLASAYTPHIEMSFSIIFKLMETQESAWLIRYVHANGASLFFICMYIHVGRGIYYGSYANTHTWNVGVTILLLTMATAFLGYVLPVNQMSFWGASVITNLFSEVPYIGPSLVQLIWGGVTVSSPTITRFFTFHFILPFVILALVMIHITFLHTTGSNNPLGLSSSSNKLIFHSFYSTKDMLGVVLTMLLFLVLTIYAPLMLGDDENFILANPSSTPHHIQPEWYFLFAYAILRSIPNKLGGVIALVLSILILYMKPFTILNKKKSMSFYPFNKVFYWLFISTIMLLTWIGMRPVEEPYILTGQVLTTLYFIYYFIDPLAMKIWDKLLN